MSRILISVDHKWRDLPGYVYLARLLEIRGHTPRLVRNGLEKFELDRFKPDFVLMVHLYDPSRQEFAKKLKSMGVGVGLLPTEGIPTLEGYRYFASGADNDLGGVDINFVWNQPMAEILRTNRTVNPDSICVVGVPRFDFYRKPLSALLVSKREFCRKYRLSESRKIVTFATNFTQAQFHTNNKEFFQQDGARLGYRKVMEEHFGGAESVVARDYRSRFLCIEAFQSMVENFPDVNFVLKLHPSEDQQFYYRLFEGRLRQHEHRVRIITQEYIWDVLNVTDVELKRSCTTGVEAWLLGRPTVEMKLNPDEWYFSPDHASGSELATSEGDVSRFIKYYLEGGRVPEGLLKARSKFIDQWCHVVDGHATQRLVERLDLHLRQSNAGPPMVRSSLSDRIKGMAVGLGDHLIHDLRIYGLVKTMRGRYVDSLGREDKHFHHSDAHMWASRMSSLMEKAGTESRD